MLFLVNLRGAILARSAGLDIIPNLKEFVEWILQ